MKLFPLPFFFVVALAPAFSPLSAHAQDIDETVEQSINEAMEEAAEAIEEAAAAVEVHVDVIDGDSADDSPLRGDWPETTPVVRVDIDNQTVGEALTSIAEQAKWDLAMTLPEETQQQRITLKLQSRSAAEALKTLLPMADLEATLSGNLLSVKRATFDVQRLRRDTKLRIRKKLKGIKKRRGKNDRVVIGDPLHIAVDETVGDAVAIGGPLSIEGRVRGDAIAVGGPVSIASTAEVDGDVVSMGGPVDIDPGAIIHGSQVNLTSPIGGLLSGAFGGLAGSKSIHLSPLIFGWGATLLRGITLFILALLLVTFMPERIGRVRDFVAEEPGRSTLGGLGVLLGFIPLIVLLAITIIGIPLIPVAIFAFIALFIIGMTAFSVWLGEKIPVAADKKSMLGAMAIGVVVIVLVDLIPFAGTPIVFIVALYAAGATLMSRVGNRRNGGSQNSTAMTVSE